MPEYDMFTTLLLLALYTLQRAEAVVNCGDHERLRELVSPS